ncbi:MAG: DNA replication/repair protein RecF [Acidimicrobiia bacterium]
MRVTQLTLTDFRCYENASVELPPGVTVIVGANGQGKTSLLEAVGWVATTRSFRAVPDAALVRTGCEHAVLRAEVTDDGRTQLLEAELHAQGRNRVQLNRHPLARARELLGLLRVTVFAPDDLQLVKGGPAERRAYLDELLVSITPRYEAARTDFERVLRQRNALLRGGLAGEDARSTLAVFDEQLVRAGGELVRGRLRLVDRLTGPLGDAYEALAGEPAAVGAAYEAEWAEGVVPSDAGAVEELLRAALVARQRQELDRGVTLVGPHRDEWRLRVEGLDARTHSSQGEQRTLALALRLAGHRVCAEVVGDDPVLLLDDVFSELDPLRGRALVEHLPPGQTLFTSASALPDGIRPELRLRVAHGRLGKDDGE